MKLILDTPDEILRGEEAGQSIIYELRSALGSYLENELDVMGNATPSQEVGNQSIGDID